ncbi:zinc finger protein 268-like isoform X1 [Pteronotus mesoamericanus]|uniref:zinc finger protein 268-like isoform X1 n=1 Tax=Pteronotus mesoamericanus TaxID=1884717 RepID=UPI0023EBB99D|nr:zinc finger protein 268-like isoform X1 [Pteronotus parnellii mesoamericanus]
MGARVRTAALWVPPLQERDSSSNRIRKLQGQEPTMGQGTPDQRPFPRGPQQRHKSYRTEQAPGWLFTSQEQPKSTKSQTKSVKFIITWNVIRKIKTSWEAWQIALSVLHLENYVFLLQIIFLQDRRLINVAHVERV